MHPSASPPRVALHPLHLSHPRLLTTMLIILSTPWVFRHTTLMRARELGFNFHTKRTEIGAILTTLYKV